MRHSRATLRLVLVAPAGRRMDAGELPFPIPQLMRAATTAQTRWAAHRKAPSGRVAEKTPPLNQAPRGEATVAARPPGRTRLDWEAPAATPSGKAERVVRLGRVVALARAPWLRLRLDSST